MKPAHLIVTLSAVLLLAACSGSQKAGEANFKKAVNDYNDTHPLCLPMSPASDDMSGGVFGEEILRIAHIDAEGKRTNRNALKQLELLAKEGVYKRGKDETADGSKSRYAVFTLTEKGKKYFIGSAANPHLCIGRTRVEKINWFSQPTADNGLTVSRVSYRGHHELHPWAKKLMKAGNPDVSETLDQPVNAQTTLVLTNKGWLDIRMLD